MAFTFTNPVAVGAATEKPHYDTLFDNDQFLYSNHLLQSFRGLHVRSRPSDVDGAAIVQAKADEIIMDDGTRLTFTDWLECDMAASAGAGGRDGLHAESASTWWQLYAIAKADGTKALLFHRAKDFFKDTAFETAPDSSNALRFATGTPSDREAQGFQISATGPIEFADVLLITTSTKPNGRMWLTIESDNGSGSPNGSILATSEVLDSNYVPSVGSSWVRFGFRTPPTLSTGSTYHLILNAEYTRSDSVYMAWSGVIAGGYASGQAKQYNGTTWSNATNVADFNFRIYRTRNDDAVSLPSGYTKKCLISYCYNDASSNLLRFQQTDRMVRIEPVTVVAATNVAIPTLVSLETCMPPVPVQAELTMLGSVAADQWLISPLPEGYKISGGRVPGYLLVCTHVATSAYAQVFGPLITEYQALYWMRLAGTGNLTLGLNGFRW